MVVPGPASVTAVAVDPLLAMIESMVELGAVVDQLERLVALPERSVPPVIAAPEVAAPVTRTAAGGHRIVPEA